MRIWTCLLDARNQHREHSNYRSDMIALAWFGVVLGLKKKGVKNDISLQLNVNYYDQTNAKIRAKKVLSFPHIVTKVTFFSLHRGSGA